MRELVAGLGDADAEWTAEARYLFVAHPTAGGHPQHDGEIMHYDESTVTMEYVRQRWSNRFQLLDVSLMLGDPHQVRLTLRRLPAARHVSPTPANRHPPGVTHRRTSTAACQVTNTDGHREDSIAP